MLPLKKNIKGNTIIEVLIAFAITSFCAALAVLIYLNVQKSSLPFFKLKAMELAENYVTKTIHEKTWIDDTFHEEEFSIKKTVTLHALLNDCYVLRIIVFDASKNKLVELERVVYAGQ